jgi:hypothetical protein
MLRELVRPISHYSPYNIWSVSLFTLCYEFQSYCSFGWIAIRYNFNLEEEKIFPNVGVHGKHVPMLLLSVKP